MKLHSRLAAACVAWAAAAVPVSAARAEASHVTVGRALSVAYLPVMVMESRKLLEKHARAAGLGEISVDYKVMTSGTQINDALISGSMQIATGGITPFLVLWSRTRGKIDVKGLSPFNSTALYLNTRKPGIRSVKDFTAQDRIAVIAPITAQQSILLRMAAAKEFGQENHGKLDALTVGMPLADAAAQLIAGGSGHITADFTVPPFTYQELAVPDVHTVLTSTQVLGGGAPTYGLAYTTGKFFEENPRTCEAFVAALREAIDYINTDRKGAQEIFLSTLKSKPPMELVEKMMSDPEISFGQQPQHFMTYSKFMHEIGMMKEMPASWKDMFFPGAIQDMEGS